MQHVKSDLRRDWRLPFFFILLALITCAASGQSGTGLSPSDILRFPNIQDPQISPDGQFVAYTLSTVENNLNRASIWIARSAFESRPQSRALVTGPLSASNPRWSPDSKRLAFLGSNGKESGLWVISIQEQRPKFIAALRGTNFFITYAGESIAWAPDSKRIAFINASEPDELSTSQHSDDPRVIDRTQYKSRTSLSDDLRTHVWIVDVDETNTPQQLTSGKFYDHALSFSPRGDEIAFLSNHEQNPDENNNSDIFAVNLQGQVRQITQTRGCEYEPAWSPDGKFIAYAATKRDLTTIDSVAEDTHVWVVESDGGTGHELTAALNRRAKSPHWAMDSRSVYFSANDRGSTHIYNVAIENSQPRVLFLNWATRDPIRPRPDALNGTVNGDPAMNSANQVLNFSNSMQKPASFALMVSGAIRPTELWEAVDDGSPNGRFRRRLTQHNPAAFAQGRLVEPEEISFKSFDETNVQGWLMKPIGFKENQHYPMILSIHGGPHGMFGYAFNSTFQVYAARGYAVLFINPRGSSGYGQNFSDGTLNQWGGGDYKDLMAGVDFVLKRNPWIDPNRLGVTGGSYGGFMTNWIITQTPRFRAAVAHASVSNLISFYATSLYQDLVHAEFGGLPWDNFELLWQWSPLHFVKQVQTPTMFIHGEMDNDVHITQAEEMYMALKRRGVDTVLVRYPREGHGLREPRHRVDALERTLAWFDKYLK